MEKEIWKDIEGYEDCHQISNQGRVRSFYKYDAKQKRYIKKEYIHNIYDHPVGHKQAYKYVNLSAPNRTGQLKVHRLVLQAFVPNPENKCCCNHIDSNPSNNNLYNLEWVTHKENMQHSMKYGRIAMNKKRYFAVEMMDKVVSFYKEGYGIDKVARKCKIPSQAVKDILIKKDIKRRTLQDYYKLKNKHYKEY